MLELGEMKNCHFYFFNLKKKFGFFLEKQNA